MPLGLFSQESNINYFTEIFDVGEKYHVFQYRVNVRSEPNRDSSVVAVLSIHDEIEILENTWNHEQINGFWSFWYKIKYGNITGYTFGGNIAWQTIITDIDKNGVDDYFSCRTPVNASSIGPVYTLRDIRIYINNERISTRDIVPPHRKILTSNEEGIYGLINEVAYRDEYGHQFDLCRIKQRNGYVIIEMLDGYRDYMKVYVYKVFPNGMIQFIREIDDDSSEYDNY
jgi:hypothetical protein